MPNPVSQYQALTISLPNVSKPCIGQIVDLNGRIMDEIKLQSGNNAYPIHLKSGIYVLSIVQNEVNCKVKIIVK